MCRHLLNDTFWGFLRAKVHFFSELRDILPEFLSKKYLDKFESSFRLFQIILMKKHQNYLEKQRKSRFFLAEIAGKD